MEKETIKIIGAKTHNLKVAQAVCRGQWCLGKRSRQSVADPGCERNFKLLYLVLAF